MSNYYDTLVTADVCRRQGLAPDWRFLDCRFDLADPAWGVEVYRESHIPGAFFAHLEHDLSGPVTPASGRHPLPDWRVFAERLSQWGIHQSQQVVIYDQASGAFAARLWWLLRAVGHQRVAVLDGGWEAWQRVGGSASDNLPAAHSVAVELTSGSGWVTTEEVESNLRNGAFLLVDARSEARFAGRREPIDALAGHIPGAVNFPLEQNLSADGQWLAADRLRELWQSRLQGFPAVDVVHMCGSGVTACHNLLAMEVAGLTGSRLYPGSWSEWIRDPDHPVATAGD